MTDSVLSRLGLKSPEASDGQEAEYSADLGVFGYLRGIRDRAVMLELRKKDGNVLAVGYAWLDKVEFDPSEGITLSLGGQKVHIRGRNLNAEARPGMRLFQGICQHRVPWIQEADEPAAMEAQNQGVLVDEIAW